MVAYFCDSTVAFEILWVSTTICSVGVIVSTRNRADVAVTLFTDVWILTAIEKKYRVSSNNLLRSLTYKSPEVDPTLNNVVPPIKLYLTESLCPIANPKSATFTFTITSPFFAVVGHSRE